MGGVHRVAHEPVKPGVADAVREGLFALVEQVDQLGVQADLGQREQRVQKHPARVAQVDPDLRVDPALLFVREHARAVRGAGHVPEPVGLDHVAEVRVEDQPAREELGIEDETLHRVAEREQSRADVLEGALLPGPLVVVDQRVVHVATHRADRAQVQGAVAEDSTSGDVVDGVHAGAR